MGWVIKVRQGKRIYKNTSKIREIQLWGKIFLVTSENLWNYLYIC
jgi:hypothetical protein